MNIYGTKITESVFEEVILPNCPTLRAEVKSFTLDNGWMSVELINYGATIRCIRVPDKKGALADVVLGYDNMRGYMKTKNNPYFGATIGRVCNRIAKGKFELNGIQYKLSKNEGEHTLHGGVLGFDKKLWEACVDEEGVVMTMESDHLDEGFPGRLVVRARFTLTNRNQLVVRYSARTDRPTPVNLTNHSYFNLAGHNGGADALYRHRIKINAYNFTPTDDDLIPKGKIQDVYGTCLDLHQVTDIGKAIKGTGRANGFDINYCLKREAGMNLVARVSEPETGRVLEVFSNQPGVQFYTANCLSVKEGKGKDGVAYGSHAAFCLETQNFPNAINVKHFPSCVLTEECTYEHYICYKFEVDDCSRAKVEREEESQVAAEETDEEKRDEGLGDESSGEDAACRPTEDAARLPVQQPREVSVDVVSQRLSRCCPLREPVEPRRLRVMQVAADKFRLDELLCTSLETDLNPQHPPRQ